MNTPAYDVRGGSEAAAPESVGKDYYVAATSLFLGFSKPSSELRLNPERIEVFGGNRHGTQPLGMAGSGQAAT